MSVAKKKRVRAESEAKRLLDEYCNEMRQRGVWARKIYKAQDEKTQEAIRETVEILSAMADRSGKAKINTQHGQVMLDVDQSVFEDGWIWVAVRLFLSAYEWDIRIANFKPLRKKKAA